MYRLRAGLILFLVFPLFLGFSCGGDDGGDEDQPTNNNGITINGQRFTVTSITVNERNNFTSTTSWEVILADATYAPHVNNDDYEGNGIGIIIDYISENDPVEINTGSEPTNQYDLRITAYVNGDIYQSRLNDPNTHSLTVSVSGNEVTIQGDGEDSGDSNQTFSFVYQGSSSVFN